MKYFVPLFLLIAFGLNVSEPVAKTVGQLEKLAAEETDLPYDPDAPELEKFKDLPVNDEGKVVLEADAWRDFLSEEAFHILREHGTEWKGTGKLTDHKAEGTYHCAGCGLFLYDSTHKFHSGCGWPAFDDEVPNAVIRLEDRSAGMVRTEIRCARCDGHLGHVFVGERMTKKNMRHCVNSASLVFVPAADAE